MEKLAGQMDSLAKKGPSQLIYIQSSKGIYEPLEDLWFKAYLLDSRTFAPSSLCQTLYLQMLHENTKKVVWQEKYEVQNGFVDGHVFLQDTLSAGDYLLAAYTSNSFFGDSSDLKSICRIQIRKELKPNYDGWIEPVNLPVKSKKGPIQFNTFPEGGNLVAGIQSKIAFKALNEDGAPLDIQETLFEDSIPLLSFKSAHAGMGSLELTPVAGKKYYIRLLDPATDSIYLLPEVYSEGMSLQLISRDKEFLEFKVSQSPAIEKKIVYLRGHIRGIVCCIARGELLNELNIKIPLKEFPFQGIAEFTLFNDSLTPIAERLVYVNPEKKLFITTELNKVRYETKEKATLKITVKDENGQPVVANLGVSIYDKLYQNQADPVNILTHCYLTSQLRGKIYNPGYYFDSKNTDRVDALDLLLQTQGWRRYVWDESALKESGKLKQQVILDGVEGEVHATKNQKKAQSMQQFVMVYNAGKKENTKLLLADSFGKFAITPQHLKECQGSYVYLKPMAPEEYKPRISLSDPFQRINRIRTGKEINYPLPGPIVKIKEEVPLDPYVEGRKTIKIPEVTVTARGSGVFRNKYIGQLDSLAKLESPFWVCKHGYLEGYKDGYSHECNDTTRTKPVDGKTYRLIKYVRIDGSRLEVVADVYDIEFQDPKFTEEELLKMNNLSSLKAYYVHREFYQPNYDNVTWQDSLSDFRNTLLWRPLVITNEKGEATVEFFCSDLNTGFVGTIEGINGEGLLGTKDFEFSVRKILPAKSGK